MKTIISALAILLSCTIFGQTTANATPNQFLTALRNDPDYTFTGTDQAFLKLGFGICYDILDGITADQLVHNLTKDGRYDEGSAKKVIASAILFLCAEPGSIKLPATQPDSPVSGKRKV